MGVSQKLGSDIHKFCEGHQKHKLTRLHHSEGPRIHVSFCLIM